MTVFLVALLALIQSADGPLDDSAAELRARALMREIRCLVCQNQSIVDSDALVASDLRRFVRTRVAAGDSDAAIKDALVARYGDWVLLSPPLDGRTLLLWGSPFGFALIALGFWVVRRRRAPPAEPAPLSAAERARLEALTSGQDER